MPNSLNNLITLGAHTNGDYVSRIDVGTGLSTTGAVSGEGINHTLSVDASQTQITAIGTITTGTWNADTISIAKGGTGASSLNNLITLGAHTNGDYVSGIEVGTGLSTNGAASGEAIKHTLSVDASQTQITAIGALNSGSITSGFGDINNGSSSITTTGAISGGTLSGTLSTAAQTNVTSVGALDGGSITSGFGDINNGNSSITTTGAISGGTLSGTLSTAAQTNVTSVGALDGGSISSGFGDINNGSSSITTTGAISGGTLSGTLTTDDITITGSSSSVGLTINNTNTSNDAVINLKSNTTTKYILGIDGSDNDKFKIGTSAIDQSTSLTINSNGKVGIGNSSPQHTLDVDGDINLTGNLKVDGSNAVFSNWSVVSSSGNNIYRNSNVGIGTDNPDTKLHINEPPGGGNPQFKISYDNDSYFTLGVDNNSNTTFATAESGVFNFSDNVNAQAGLDVTGGDITLTGNSSTLGLTINNTDTSHDSVMKFQSNNVSKFTMGIDGSDSNKFKIGTTAVGTSTRLTIDSNGNVGIGTNNPESSLHVAGARNNTTPAAGIHLGMLGGETAIEIVAGSQTNNAYIDFTKPNSDRRGRIIYSNNNDSMVFETDSTEKMIIDSSGNVGIGTNNPQSSLHVKSTGNEGKIVIENETIALLQLVQPISTGDKTYNIELGRTDGDLTFRSTNGEKMRITENGNVGIGTDNPDTKLHINEPTGGGNPQLKISYDSDSHFTLGVDSNSNTTFATAESGVFNFSDNVNAQAGLDVTGAPLTTNQSITQSGTNANTLTGPTTLSNTLTVNGDVVIGEESTDLMIVNSNAKFTDNIEVSNIKGPSSGIWSQLGQDIDGEAADDNSGIAVSLSSDGTIVAIGGHSNDGINGTNSGHVRVYKYSGSSWSQLGGDIDGSGISTRSGRSVSLSSDGTILAVGEPFYNSNKGLVKIYQYSDSANSWTQKGFTINGEFTNDYFGWSVSLSSNGNILAIGAWQNTSSPGYVRVYYYIGNSWSQLGSDIDGEAGSDESGISVSLSSNGSIVAIGARLNDGNGNNSGHVRVYEYSESSWSQKGSDIDGEAAGDGSGWSVSLSSDGTIVAIGAYTNDGNGTDSGHVRVYKYSASSWSQLGQDIDGEAADDYSGYSVSLSSDGTILAIGAYKNDGINGTNSGHVRVYEYSGSSWSQLGGDIDGEAPSDFSGIAVSLSSDGTSVASGAYLNDGNGTSSGHVRVYKITNKNNFKS